MKRTGKVKIVLIGDELVGKTTLRKSFMGDKQTVTYLATIGADFAKRDTTLTKDNIDYLFETLIWDLAGQDAYKIVRESFYEGTNGALLVIDISNPETFSEKNIMKWLEELWKNNELEKTPFIILGNKCDLRNKNQELFSQIIIKEKLVEIITKLTNKSQKDIIYLETSAINGINVDHAFNILLTDILEKNLD